MARALVVGAGPAGIAAAGVLVRAGADVTLVDENPRPGGQIHRRPADGLRIDMRRLLSRSLEAYDAFHAKADALCEAVDYRPSTLVWSARDGEAHLASDSRSVSLGYDALVLATGAVDRVAPVAGWTLPGVFSLGGAQVLLKGQGCLIGSRTVFCGASPLLYLAALQYARMGGDVAAIIDEAPFSAKIRALPQMASEPGTLLEGLRYMRALARRGVRIVHGASVASFTGEDRVEGVEIVRRDGTRETIACDSVAYGHGLKPESQLAELAGGGLRYDPDVRLHLPETDEDGRLLPGVYACGDGAMVGGAVAAEISGRLAGAAAARDLGLLPDADAGRASLARRLGRLRRFQRGLAIAFPWRRHFASSLDNGVILCRCENVTVGEVRASLSRPFGAGDVNRVKADTRCGMGRCQGRFCGPAFVEIVAAAGGSDARPGRLRSQPPVKPLPVAAGSAP